MTVDALPPLDLVAFEVQPGRIELRPAARRRAWMDDSPGAFAYRCVPIVAANQHGWQMECPFAFEVRWNGGPAPADVTISVADNANQAAMVTSHFGCGIVTFNPMVIIRTSGAYHLWLAGPTNAFKDGIQPLSALVESDWLPYTFSMNWKITRPDTTLRFEQGEPFAQFFAIPSRVGAECTPQLTALAANTELDEQYRWAIARRQLDDMVALEPAERFQTWYRRGLLPKKGSGQGAPEDRAPTPASKPFTRK